MKDDDGKIEKKKATIDARERKKHTERDQVKTMVNIVKQTLARNPRKQKKHKKL